MKYIIKKNIHDKFVYFLDKSQNWNGLRDNGHPFIDIGYVERLKNQLQSKDKNSVVEILHVR